MSDLDWTKYGEVYAAEKTAYAAYRSEAEGGEYGRIKPTKLLAAKHAWFEALAERYKLEELIALQLGVKRFEVTILYLEETTNPKEAKR